MEAKLLVKVGSRRSCGVQRLARLQTDVAESSCGQPVLVLYEVLQGDIKSEALRHGRRVEVRGRDDVADLWVLSWTSAMRRALEKAGFCLSLLY